MAIIRTTDQDSIRSWIEEHDGVPAVIDGTTNEDSAGSLRIVFGRPDDTVQPISWEEFFGIFESRKLQFRYDDMAPPGQEGWLCAFEDRDQPRDVPDETQMPEEVEGMETNMFPSAP